MTQTRRGTRMPLRPRNINVENSSVVSTKSKVSSAVSSCSSSKGGRALSYLESSGNENNKRVELSSCSGGMKQVDDQNSSLIANTGQNVPTRYLGHRQPTEEPRARSSSRSSQRAGSSSTMSSGVSDSDEEIVFVEMRRKASGEGHTMHRYIRGKLLGKGGFAKVYWCTSEDTGKNYAVKIVPKANLVKTRARQKLQAEIKIHRTLKHKHICEYKHFFEDRTNCYILLEICANQSMNELVKRRKRLTSPEVRYFMSQLLEAVRYMHDENVIHRDLKLGNLFLDKHLRVKVGDLGLATRLKCSDEKRKTICGTPNYIAPEVINGNKETRGHSFEVDIWSMGVICFTCLVGKPPYEAKDVKSTYQRILANDYSWPTHIPIPEDARDLISRMLKTDPASRPTLDEIESHPFFDEYKMPASLPQSSTHVAPEFEEDEFGHLVIVQNKAVGERVSSKTRPANRIPLSHRDLNRQSLVDVEEPKTHCAPAKEAYREESGMQRHQALQTRTTMASSQKFQIFDDNNFNDDNQPPSEQAPPRYHEKPPQSRAPVPIHYSSVDKDINAITEKTAALTVDTKPELPISQEVELNKDHYVSPKAASSDLQVLEMMHTKLRETLNRAESVRYGLEGISRPQDELQRVRDTSGPAKWVTRYVDYTSKYGLGFLLSDGSAGVYFNDSTKAVHAAKGENFMYVDRKKSSPKSQNGNEILTEIHTTSSYPESLQKKVTLLKHFRNYLQEQQEKSGDEDGIDCGNVISGHEELNGDDDANPLVYLKKWVRTKHAILFRMSDLTVQVVFYDHTEILLSPDAKFVTFVDKRRKRMTYELAHITPENHQDVSKRLKYSKDIIHQLISGTKSIS
mmetsp:Transcript_8932/g.13217  ORF Transcript_8932/g.13217 Transcript_8932/m.13217 type:complete len:853 (-) Transcript_8932:133-2691(-)